MATRKPTVLLAVLDAVGIPTLEHLLRRHPRRARLPNLTRLGLGKVLSADLLRHFGRARGRAFVSTVEQASSSADSVIGHREMVGIVDKRTYGLFCDGFPKSYIAALEKRIGRKTLFNKMAGGMEAIERNAKAHARTGRPIVYASKCDPLIQFAMDEAVIAVPEQHAIADKAFNLAREMRIPVTRAIARSYVRVKGEFVRTPNRYDAVLPLDGKTLVDVLADAGVWTVSVGKISDLVNTKYDEERRLSERRFLDPKLGLRFVHPKKKDTNPFAVQSVVNTLKSSKVLYRPKGTFIFANFVDCDSLYGHSRDHAGAVASIEEFDRTLGIIERFLGPGNLLILTADHGMEHRADYGYHHLETLPLVVERIGQDCSHEFRRFRPRDGLTGIGQLVASEFGCAGDYKVIRVG